MEAIKLNAGHDANGNPRRVYVIIDKGEIIGARAEGYNGYSALKSLWRCFTPDPALACPSAAYPASFSATSISIRSTSSSSTN